MNFIDIIVAIVLVIAAIGGLRSGVTRQLFSIVGVIVGFILANKFAMFVGTFIGLSNQWALIAGFVLVFVLAMVLTSLVGGLIKKLFHAVGLGIFDYILGAALGVAKAVIILAVVFALLTPINANFGFIPADILDSSIAYNSIMKLVGEYSFEWWSMESVNIDNISNC